MENLLSGDPARIDELSAAVAHILPALEAFTRFDGPDLAARRSIWQAALNEPLPQQGVGASAVLDALTQTVIPYGLRTGAPGFSGWVTTMPTIVPAIASFAGCLTAPQRWWASPGNFLEELALRWLAELLDLPSTFQGVFVSGGSTANLVGLGAARQHAGERRGIDPSAEGVGGLHSPRVYASTEVHHVVLRALGVLGLGRKAMRIVPVDQDRQLDVAELTAMLEADIKAGFTPVAVVASAGDVNTGAVDPIAEIGQVAREHDVWLHVDGAYGAFGVLDERVRPLFGGWSNVDSLAVDPHKWMAAPVGCGAAFVRDRDLLGRAFTVEPADYLEGAPPGQGDTGSPFDELGYEFHNFGVEQSAPSRGLAVWAILKEIGASGMKERVTRHLNCARHVAQRVRQSGELELLAEPVLSICCFRYRPEALKDETALDALNAEILSEVRSRGRCTPSSTRVDGRFAIRPCFINPRSTLADADALVDEVLTVERQRFSAT